MTIEIHEPELEALIVRRMASGCFPTVEQFLLQALREETPAASDFPGHERRSGLALLEAMQAMPYNDDIDLEPYRPHMPMRDIVL